MTKYFFAVLVAIVVVSVLAPVPVKANSIDTFVFQTCFGLNGGCSSATLNNTYTWQTPSSPTPTSFSPGPPWFDISADVTANGTDLGAATIEFDGLGGGNAGGFYITGNGYRVVALEGPVVWSGTDSSPTFTLGTYEFSAISGPYGTLTISSSTDVPEPSALLQTGAGLLVGLAAIAFWRQRSPVSIAR